MPMSRRTNFNSIAEQKGIEVLHFCLPNSDSVSTEIDGKCFIGVDNARPLTYAEEQARIGHELGHCLYGGFYSRTTPYDLMERHEVRADRWYIKHAIPCGTLFELLHKGYDAWEIAERLDTTEEYVRRAYYYYKENT